MGFLFFDGWVGGWVGGWFFYGWDFVFFRDGFFFDGWDSFFFIKQRKSRFSVCLFVFFIYKPQFSDFQIFYFRF